MTKIPCYTGLMVSAGNGNMYQPVVMALLTYHLSSVSNLHLIFGLMWVRGLGHQVLGLGSQAIANISGAPDL